jgi:hypothetical protein
MGPAERRFVIVDAEGRDVRDHCLERISSDRSMIFGVQLLKRSCLFNDGFGRAGDRS